MDSIIAYLKDFLYTHRLTSLIGLLAIVTLIWFACPSIGITQLVTKITIIATIIGIYSSIILGRFVWSHWKQKKSSKLITTEQINLTEKQAQINALKEKMQAGIAALKTSALAKKYRTSYALYALPWYLVIGPATGGKSSLLKNSDLHFSAITQVANHNQIAINLNNFDWWFSQEAVLIDTAGRYTTNLNDREEWLTFLNLLQKKRARLPINGILVVFSIADLLLMSEQEIPNHSKMIRERIAEIYQTLKFIIPVYFIFSKIDLLPGFSEFFSNLNEDERCQVWGIAANQELDRDIYFSNKLDELYKTLTYLRMHKLALEQSQKNKFALYDFPEHFFITNERLKILLSSLLRKSPYQETPDVHGVYFTSSMQDGSLIKCKTEDKSFAFNPAEPLTPIKDGKTNSYFITNLLRQVIFRQRLPPTRTHRQLMFFRHLKSTLVIANISIITLTTLMFAASFTANSILLHRGKITADKLMQNLSNKNHTSSQFYSSLNDAFNFYLQLIVNQKTMPWYLHLGLYRADIELPFYQKLLNQSLIITLKIPLQNEIETKLNQFALLWQNNSAERESLRGNYYALLRLYLMLCYPKYLDVNFANHELLPYWLADLKSKTANIDLQQTKKLLIYYLNQMGKLPDDNNKNIVWQAKNTIIIKARQQLATETNIENLYAFMIRCGLNQLGSITLTQLIASDPHDSLISNFRLPVIYTQKGWYEFVLPMIEKILQANKFDDWVMQDSFAALSQPTSFSAAKPTSNINVATLKHSLENFYFDNYAKTWLMLIQSIQIKSFVSFEEATQRLNNLSQPENSLTHLFQAVSDNSNFIHENSTSQSLEHLNVIGRQAQQFNDSLAGVKVTNFSAEAKPLQDYLQQLNKIKNDTERLGTSSDSMRDANLFARELLNGTNNTNSLLQATLAVDTIFTNMPDFTMKNALRNLLLAPIRNTWQIVLQAASQDLQRQWQQKIFLRYQQTIANRFPFSRRQNDAYLIDVANFLRPQTGYLWNFINTDLAPYLVANNDGWQAHSWLGMSIRFNASFLQSLIKGQEISNGLFQQNSETPAFILQVYPIPTPGLSQITLENNNSELNYRNGPQEWATLLWQAQTNSKAMLKIITAHQTGSNAITQEGTWALWRVLAAANLNAEPSGVIQAEWQMPVQGKNYKVRFLFRTSNNNNFLRELLLDHWQLPIIIIDR